jgi:hypothetical protein
MLNVYIGYDRNEARAWDVCRDSLLAHASGNVNVVRLDQGWLRRIGLYRRQSYMENTQRYDCIDCRPYSTEFSFTRFLVPSLQPEGYAVFVDSDFLWRDDIHVMMRDIDPDVAVSVVKHDYHPPEGTKMRGQIQQDYPHKGWSSLMVWNCNHPLTRMLSPYEVNRTPGAWLHGLKWLSPSDIGRIDESWNCLEGHTEVNNPQVVVKAMHYTRGTPDMPGHENVPFADEWWRFAGAKESSVA